MPRGYGWPFHPSLCIHNLFHETFTPHFHQSHRRFTAIAQSASCIDVTWTIKQRIILAEDLLSVWSLHAKQLLKSALSGTIAIVRRLRNGRCSGGRTCSWSVT
jgi:hypothetical protein